jgi:cellulose synthase/poly-beta-1,6-N-acetylglucosamine synthase-like glycosyltransferase
VLLAVLPLLQTLAACGLLLYGLNCYILLFLHRRACRRMRAHDEAVEQAWQASHPSYPRVTVQLPVYNERYVIQRLVEATVRLQYPREQLEIHILDDSTDATTAIAARLVEHYGQEGFHIALRHRQHRHGYKAGALAEGLADATGEFIAIFDADFVPEPDFLLRTLPFMCDPTVAMVQARWGYINRDYSVLTLAQSLGLDGHFGVEQPARCWSGLCLSFHGSGGLWRRKAIDDAGGWQADTLTEDLDLSYRAQLRGWRLKFVPHVVCPSELPIQMLGVKSQQHRWAKGSVQTAKKLLPRVLRADMPPFTKWQAVYHLTNYLVHPFMLCTLLAWPAHLQAAVSTSLLQYGLITLSVVLALCGPVSLYMYAQYYLYKDWLRRLWCFPFLLVLGTGMALNNTRAILEALCNMRSPFVRTPKFRVERAADTWIGKRYRSAFPWLSLGEILLAAYSGYRLYFSYKQGTLHLQWFLLLYTVGFATVAGLSVQEFLRQYCHTRQQRRGRARA